ncbi:MAG: hypothetical protein AB1516_15480 [Pseudomonadota bacterium]
MEDKFAKYKNAKHYKDGEARGTRGRWAGKLVTLRTEYYALIEGWQKQTGISKAQFWRQAVMLGALKLAQSYGIDASYPPLVSVEVPPEFPSVNDQPPNGWLHLLAGGLR